MVKVAGGQEGPIQRALSAPGGQEGPIQRALSAPKPGPVRRHRWAIEALGPYRRGPTHGKHLAGAATEQAQVCVRMASGWQVVGGDQAPLAAAEGRLVSDPAQNGSAARPGPGGAPGAGGAGVAGALPRQHGSPEAVPCCSDAA